MNNNNNPSNIKIQMNNFTLNLQTLLTNDDDKLLPTTYRKNTKTQRAKTNYDDVSPIKVKKKVNNNKDACGGTTNNKQQKNVHKKQQFATCQQLTNIKPQHSKSTKLVEKKDKRQVQGNLKKVKKTEQLHMHTESSNNNNRSKSKKQKSTRLEKHFTDYDYVIESARLRTSPSIHFFNNNNNNMKKFNSESISKSGSKSKSKSKSFKKKKELQKQQQHNSNNSNHHTKSRSKSTFSTNNNYERLTTRKSTQKVINNNVKGGQKKKRKSSKSKQQQQRKSIDQFGKTMMNKSKSRQRIYTQASQKYNHNHFESNNTNNNNNINHNSNDERISLSHKKTKSHHYRQQSENLISQSSDNGVVLGPKFASNKINSKERVKEKSVNKVKTKKISNGVISVTNIHKASGGVGNNNNINKVKKIDNGKKQTLLFNNNSSSKGQKAALAAKHKSASMSQQNHFYQSTITNNMEKKKFTQSDLNNYFEKSAHKKSKRVKTQHGNANEEEGFDVHGLSSMKKVKKREMDYDEDVIQRAFKKKKNKQSQVAAKSANVEQKLFHQNNKKEPQQQQFTTNQHNIIQIPKRRIKRQKNLTIQTTFRHQQKGQLCFDDISKILNRRRQGESASEEGRSERSIKEEIMMQSRRSEKDGWFEIESIESCSMKKDNKNNRSYLMQQQQEIRRLKTQQLQDSDQQQQQDQYSQQSSNNDDQDENQDDNLLQHEQGLVSYDVDVENQQQQREEDSGKSQLKELEEVNERLTERIVKQRQQLQQKQQQQQRRSQQLDQQYKLSEQRTQHKTPFPSKLQSLPSCYGIQNKQKILRSLNKTRKSIDQQQRIARTLSNKKLLQQLQLLQTLQKIQKSVQNSLIQYEGNNNNSSDYHLLSTSSKGNYNHGNHNNNNININHAIDKERVRQQQQYGIQGYNTITSQYKTITQLQRQLLAAVQQSQQAPALTQQKNQHKLIKQTDQHSTIKQHQEQQEQQCNLLLESEKIISPQNIITNQGSSRNNGLGSRLSIQDNEQKEDSSLLQNEFKRSSPIHKFDFDINYGSIDFNSNKSNIVINSVSNNNNNVSNDNNAFKKEQQADSCQFQLYATTMRQQKSELMNYRKGGEYSQLALEFQKQMDDYLKDVNHCQHQQNAIMMNKQTKKVDHSKSELHLQQQQNTHYLQKSSCQFFYYPNNSNDKNDINSNIQPININTRVRNIIQQHHQQQSHQQLIQSQLTEHITNQLVKQFTIMLSKHEVLLHKFLHYVSQANVQLLLDEGEVDREGKRQHIMQMDNSNNNKGKRKPIFDPFQALDDSNADTHNLTCNNSIINNTPTSNNQRQINQNQFLTYLQSKIYATNQYIINLACQLFNFVKTSSQHEEIFLRNINKSFGLKPLKTLKWMRKAFTENDHDGENEYVQGQQYNSNAHGGQQQQQHDGQQQQQLSDLSQNEQLQAVFSPILLADFDAMQNEIIFQQINQQQYYLNHAVYASLNEISDFHRPYGENGPPVIPKHKPVMNTSVIMLQPKILAKLQACLSLRMGRTQFLPQQQPQKLILQSYKRMDLMIVQQEHQKWSQRNLQDLVFESKYYLAMYILDLIMNQEVMEIWRLVEG